MTTTGTLIRSHIRSLRGTPVYEIALDNDMSFITTNRDWWQRTEQMVGKQVRVTYTESRGTLWFNRVEEVKDEK